MIARSFKLRSTGGYWLILACYTVIMIRCFFIQVMHYTWYHERALHQKEALFQEPALRATVYDRTGIPLVCTHMASSIYLCPRSMTDAQYTSCRELIKQNVPERYESFMRARSKAFWYLIRHIPEDKIAIYRDQWKDLIHILPEPIRGPVPAAVQDIVGVCDTDTQGISGLELTYQTALSGTPSRWMVHKDGHQRAIPLTKTCIDQGIPSQDVHTTLDLNLSSYAHQELVQTMHTFGSTAGAILVLDPYTGDVLCATQHQHGPNDECLQEHQPHHLAITQSFELGSVMKTFLALAAYQTEVVTPDELIDCFNTTHAMVHGFPVSTWKPDGIITFFDVIAHSNNIGTVQVAHRVGRTLFDVYRACGFGQKTGIDWPGEVSGFINPPERWSKQSLNSLSFGYEIQATLLQLACAYGLLYTGSRVTPRLHQKKPLETGPSSFNPQARQATLAILKSIVKPQQISWNRPDITLYGKTGTARMLDESGHYSDKKHLYTFAGILAHPDYARVIVTCIKQARRHDLYASQVTLPLFMRVAWHLAIHEDHVGVSGQQACAKVNIPT